MEHRAIKINNIEIDRLIALVIKELWNNNIETYMCCQGGVTDLGSEFNQTNLQFYNKNNRCYECAWIFIDSENVDRVKEILINLFKIQDIILIEGNNGYVINEVELTQVCWKRI
jgi:hypothetical protein